MSQDLICFSHLRWNFVYQRPQHLLSRYGKSARVFYVEEPLFDADEAFLEFTNTDSSNIVVATPHLPGSLSDSEINDQQRRLVDSMILSRAIYDYILWYYTPMSLPYTKHLHADLIIYDCMDQLSGFKNAPPSLIANEKELFAKADLVLTGGKSLFEAKKRFHLNIHPLPSAIDKHDFFPARTKMVDPGDQKNIPSPRIGFYGVIDERFDLGLVDQIATLQPNWHFVFIGPVVKIDPSTLPTRSNIHYLGSKSYKDLPAYISNWDICIMPFALNDSTKYISPTKTPEFLAAGKPVISTAITDVIDPYGNLKLVHIEDDAHGFIEAISSELALTDKSEWLGRVDYFLSGISWDKTFDKIKQLIAVSLSRKALKKTPNTEDYV